MSLVEKLAVEPNARLYLNRSMVGLAIPGIMMLNVIALPISESLGHLTSGSPAGGGDEPAHAWSIAIELMRVLVCWLLPLTCLPPVARSLVECTALHAGVPSRDLAPGRGWRWLFGLHESDPWWMVWLLTAPMAGALAMSVLTLVALRAFEGLPHRLTAGVGVAAVSGMALMLLMVPLTRALWSSSTPSRRST